MTAYLFIEQGPRSGETIVLDVPLVVAGRDPECALRLPDAFISRRQFRVEAEGGAYFLENLAPHNATLLNGDEERGRVPLEDDDVIQVGATRIRFCAGAPEVEAPAKEIVGSSWQTERLRERVRQVAQRSGPALIRGDAGTGKSVVARAIHAASALRDRPLATVVCAAPHRVPEADGALFLDEVAELSAEGQAKVLALVDAGVRVLASTSRALDGTFHRDLAERFAACTIDVTPLSARKDDVVDLARSFLARYERALGPLAFTPAALEKLRAHGWPGNVRELRVVVERAVIFSPGAEIDADAVELDPTMSAELGRERVERALAVTNRRHKAAAAALRVSRSVFYEHVTKYAP